MIPTPPRRAPGAAHRPGARRRRATALAAAAALALAAPLAEVAAAPARCSDPQEQAMFEIAALQAELSAVGITCRQEERYDAFVQRFRPQLLDNYRQITAYINRHGGRGRGGPTAADTYITNLQQARSSAGSRLGSDLCPRNTGLFDEVMSLSAATDLAAYAAGKDLVPADMAACAPAAGAATPVAARSGPRGTAAARSRGR